MKTKELLITHKDIWLFSVLLGLGYITTKQFAEIRYPGSKSKLPMAQRRGLALVEAKFLRRIEQPIYRKDRSKPKQYIYTNGKRAAETLSKELGIPLANIPHAPRPSYERLGGSEKAAENMKHALAISDFWLHLIHSSINAGTKLTAWYGETVFRKQPIPISVPRAKGGPKKEYLEPDALYGLHFADGTTSFFFHEQDRATEVLRAGKNKKRSSWEQKLHLYKHLDRQSHELLAGIDSQIRITVVTKGQQRANNIRALAEEILGMDDHRVWVTTESLIQPYPHEVDPSQQSNLLTDTMWLVSGVERKESICS